MTEDSKLTLEEWHAAFTARHVVTLVVPAHVGRGQRKFAEERNDVPMVKARSVVAHRILHGMTPKEAAELKAAFVAADVDSTHPDAFEMWALRLIDSLVGDKGPGEGEFALSQVLDLHAHPKQIAAHRASILAAASKPD